MTNVTFLNINGEKPVTTLEQLGDVKFVSRDGDQAVIEVSEALEMALHQMGVQAENDRPRVKRVPLQWKVQIG